MQRKVTPSRTLQTALLTVALVFLGWLCVLAARPDLVSLYRRSIIADESLPVTILCNTPSLRVCPDNHHWIRMTGAGLSHASVLTIEELPELRASGKWFARKFDPAVDGEVLADWLEEEPRQTVL